MYCAGLGRDSHDGLSTELRNQRRFGNLGLENLGRPTTGNWNKARYQLISTRSYTPQIIISNFPHKICLICLLFIIYVNDLSDNLTIDHLLYADDVKLIAPRKQSDTLQRSLLASSKWSEDWELILNPSKSEHLPIGDTSNPVAYSLTSRTLPNAQPIQTVSSVRDLGLLLNTGFSVNDNVARATKKARGMFFT